LQENAKYCVIRVFETVIYESKLLNFKKFESLVFDDFLSKTEKKVVFLLPLIIKKDYVRYWLKYHLGYFIGSLIYCSAVEKFYVFAAHRQILFIFTS